MQSPDVSDSIRKSLDQAGLNNVSVSQDRDKGIVTLGGQVASESDKSQAESLAKSSAAVLAQFSLFACSATLS
ncbi:MAG: BON domain-containing protein [Terriglobales bacterium]